MFMKTKFFATLAACLLFFIINVNAQQGLEFLIKAEDLKKANNLAGALAEYDKAIQADPKNAEYMFRKGRTYLLMREPDKALDCFVKTVALKKDYTQAYPYIATLYYSKNKTNESVAAFDNAFKTDSDPSKKMDYKLNIIQILSKEKRFKEAGNHINDAKQIDPANVEVLYFDARFQNMSGSFQKARESLDKAIPSLKSQDPRETSKYYYELYYALYNLEKYDEAAPVFPKANFGHYKTKVFEMTPFYFFQLAASYYRVYEFDHAKESAEMALKIKKDYTAARELLVKIETSRTDKTAVIVQLQTAVDVERDPNKRASQLANLAEDQYESGKYEDAIKSADACLAVQASNFAVAFIKSVSLNKLNKTNDAIVLLENLVKSAGLDQETKAQYQFALGLMYNKISNTKLANTSFQKSLFGSFKAASISELKKNSAEIEGDTSEDEKPVLKGGVKE